MLTTGFSTLHRSARAVAGAGLLSLIAGGAVAQDKPDVVTISGANPGAPWSVIGAAIANILQQDGVVRANVEQGGALTNIVAVSTGRTQVGFTSAAVVPLAEEGEEPFPSKINNIASIAAVMTNSTQILVSEESGVESIADLKGEKFASQPVGNVSQYAFELVLETNGMEESDIDLMRGGQSFGANNLKNRNAVGFTATAVTPSAAFLDATRRIDSKFLDLDEATIEGVMEKNSGFFPSDIPADTYANQPDPIRTIATRALLAVNTEMSDDEAYYLTKMLVEHLDDLQNSHSAVGRITTEIMANPPALPLHPGARRYYEEIGAL